MSLRLRLRGAVVHGEAGARAEPILRVADLDVAPGEALGVRGPSGAGKSTLLHLAAGLAAVSDGSVLWGETDIAVLAEAERDAFRRRYIGLIFQDFLLFEELSPLENAAIAASYAPRSERGRLREGAARRLKALGVPQDRRTVAGLSGGERQRVAAARALAHDPAALLADEPTASLDRAAADRLIGDLLAERGRRTLLVVSHDPAVLGAMDRVIDVVDGVVASAAPGDDGAAA